MCENSFGGEIQGEIVKGILILHVFLFLWVIEEGQLDTHDHCWNCNKIFSMGIAIKIFDGCNLRWKTFFWAMFVQADGGWRSLDEKLIRILFWKAIEWDNKL